MKEVGFLFSGFGGQGILFAGKFMANKGLNDGKNVSWLPSYGPEMRGGTASCSVIIAENDVGSPIVSNPDVLIAMNLPSFDKFEKSVKPNGLAIIDSTLIERKAERKDIKTIYIPATKMASDNGVPTLANMIIVGKVLKELGEYNEEAILTTLKKVIPAKHADMLDMNLKAIKLGAEF